MLRRLILRLEHFKEQLFGLKVKCICTGIYGGINLRDKPSFDSNIIGSIKKDMIIDVKKENSEWFSLLDGSGYVATSLIDYRGTIKWELEKIIKL